MLVVGWNVFNSGPEALTSITVDINSLITDFCVVISCILLAPEPSLKKGTTCLLLIVIILFLLEISHVENVCNVF